MILDQDTAQELLGLAERARRAALKMRRAEADWARAKVAAANGVAGWDARALNAAEDEWCAATSALERAIRRAGGGL